MTEKNLPSSPAPPQLNREDLKWFLSSSVLFKTTPSLSCVSNETFSQLFDFDLSDTRIDGAWKEVATHTARLYKLGLYGEALFKLIICLSSRVRLLAHQLPIREAKTTIGELDFVVGIPEEKEIWHIEMAVKFFSYFPSPDPTQAFENWIGPKGQETLAHKIKKISEQQLPLAKHPQVRTAPALLGLDDFSVKSYFLGKGRFFVPRAAWLRDRGQSIIDAESPIHPHIDRGWWVYANELSDEFEYALAKKIEYLTGPLNPEWQGAIALRTKAIHHFKDHKEGLLVFTKFGDSGFVMHPDWPFK